MCAKSTLDFNFNHMQNIRNETVFSAYAVSGDRPSYPTQEVMLME
jgi:hypothetical protein